MKNIDLNQLCESQNIEFKESFNTAALKTICAFANTKGGTHYLGVKDDSTLVDSDFSDRPQQNIINQIEDGVGIHPQITLHKQGDKEFLSITVQQSKTPVSYKNRYYKRVGNTTREFKADELRNFMLKDVPWDSQTQETYSFAEINSDTLSVVSIQSRGERGVPDWDSMGDEEFLTHLNLIVNGEITNAAMILFGDNPNLHFPHAKIRIGRFKGTSEIIADREISGNLFMQLRQAEESVKSLINKRYEITGESFQRHEVWDYPLPALWESLLNAIVHRNYHIRESEIQVKIYDEKIWIYNPGGLPEGLSIQQLREPHSSIPRNPLIADAFYRAGYIEKFGTGTLRIIDALKEAGHPEPEFKEVSNGFIVTLYKEKVIEKEADLNERQIAAIDLARDNPVKTSDLRKVFPELTRKTIYRDLQDLVDKGIFRQEGKGRGTQYILNE